MKKEHLDLMELMKLDGRRGNETLGTSCIMKTESLWSVRTAHAARSHAPYQNKIPLVGSGSQMAIWIIWRTPVVSTTAEGYQCLAEFTKSSCKCWRVVASTQKFADIWRRYFQTENFRGYIFHGGCFYLPMGTPDDDDLDMWAEKDIKGWVRTAYDTNVTIVLVGPRSLAGIPWLTGGLSRATRRCTHIKFTSRLMLPEFQMTHLGWTSP